MKLHIGILGASGRLGREVLKRCQQENLIPVLALASQENPNLGKDVGELAGIAPLSLPLKDRFGQEKLDVLIDVSSPKGTQLALSFCENTKTPLVIATTGLSSKAMSQIDTLSQQMPIVQSANMSLGVNLLASLVHLTAKTLKGFDIEIVETHHNQKKDAPSGSALFLAQAASTGRDQNLEEIACHGRSGMVGKRVKNEIGIHALRGGTVVGEHQIHFFGENERICLSHQAEDRSVFAIGVLRAAIWVSSQRPGRYTMNDVLGLPT